MKYYIKEILETIPETRDDDDLLIIKVGLNHNLNPKDFASIIRQRAFVQQHNPQLRGEKYLERQKHSRVFKEKLRQQEKPEELIKFYPEAKSETIFRITKIEKETLFNKFLRLWKS